MDFGWNEEQRLWRQAVRDFAQKEIAPRVREIDSKERIPSEIIKGMARLGLLAPVCSEEYGSAGMDWTVAALATPVGQRYNAVAANWLGFWLLASACNAGKTAGTIAA